LEVLTAPSSPRIYFWALQATFLDELGNSLGAAHTGLQWNPRHPGSGQRAVNWGGYSYPTDALNQLSGTVGSLDHPEGDTNTYDWPWLDRRPYRFVIHRGDAGWAATVIDVVEGSSFVVRELFVPGAVGLAYPVVWAELFCDCDDPPSAVRWSGFSVRTLGGEVVHAPFAKVTFMPVGSGQCDNTDAVPDGGGGFVISTRQRRTAPPEQVHTLMAGR
jgi:hypothetical protein